MLSDGGYDIIIPISPIYDYAPNSLSSSQNSSSSLSASSIISPYLFSSLINAGDYVYCVDSFSDFLVGVSLFNSFSSSPGKSSIYSILSISSLKPQSSIIFCSILSMEVSCSSRWLGFIKMSFRLTWLFSCGTSSITIGVKISRFFVVSSLTRVNFCISFRCSGQLLRSVYK